jgi:dTDP-4-dehydrorhamnose reductase
MLGGDLCRELARRGHEVLAAGRQEMDVRLPAQVGQVFREFAPELAFHLAALTDVDGCERQPEEAFRTNTVGTQNVALACQAADVPLLYVSTLAVFDGSKSEAYVEFDAPNPQSAYSRSKYEGERIVRQLLRRWYIVRGGWLFGGGPEDKKFVAKIVELARTRPELKVVDDKFGSPTYTRDLARAALQLSETGWHGVYHLVNTGPPVSRYELARRILEFANLGHCRVVPVSSAEFPLAAPRPRMEAGRNLRAELLGLDLMRPWPEALREYLADFNV